MRRWSLESTWLGLEVNESSVLGGKPEHALVTFTARWHDQSGEHAHQERSAFVQRDGRWYFIDPTVPLKAGRNDPALRERSEVQVLCGLPLSGAEHERTCRCVTAAT